MLLTILVKYFSTVVAIVSSLQNVLTLVRSCFVPININLILAPVLYLSEQRLATTEEKVFSRPRSFNRQLQTICRTFFLGSMAIDSYVSVLMSFLLHVLVLLFASWEGFCGSDLPRCEENAPRLAVDRHVFVICIGRYAISSLRWGFFLYPRAVLYFKRWFDVKKWFDDSLWAFALPKP